MCTKKLVKSRSMLESVVINTKFDGVGIMVALISYTHCNSDILIRIRSKLHPILTNYQRTFFYVI